MSPRYLVTLVMTGLLALPLALLLILAPADDPGSEAERRVSAQVAAMDPDEVLAEARALMEGGRSWRAARLLREYLDREPEPSVQAVLLAAHAEAGWGGWSRVRELLGGQEWLAEEGGEGLFLLARALDEEGEAEEAAAAYDRYLRAADPGDAAGRRTVARLRLGLALLRAGRVTRGVTEVEAVKERFGSAAEWVEVAAAEALAVSGDTSAVNRLIGAFDDGVLGLRQRRAAFEAAMRAGGFARAREIAREARAWARTGNSQAEFLLNSARAALEMGDEPPARAALRGALERAPTSQYGSEAARILEGLGRLSAADRLALARQRDLVGQDREAANGYRAWLDSGAGGAAERRRVRMELGGALFDAGRHAEAIEALRPLSGDPEALLLIGRAQNRRGDLDAARASFLELARSRSGTGLGVEALFLVADLSHDAGELERAREGYRRLAAEYPGRDRMGLSVMRLAGMEYLAEEYAEAAALWEEYRNRYPGGDRWLQATYWAARAYQQAGQNEEAGSRYRAVRQREPLSYYSLQAAKRLGEEFWPPPMGPSPPEDQAARRTVEGWMRGVDLLRAAGMFDEATAEVNRVADSAAGASRAVNYELAEALNERGFTLRGIRLGLALERAVSRPNPRLLRILYPFPYRELISSEARERGLDPFLAAALIRQESLFEARITSPVGARGLMQVMPETGRQVAGPLGLGEWDPEVLYHPEINTFLGMRYLADQMEAHDGSLPSVFSAYNAGPHRVERWSGFPEYGDEELFTERIPFRETRNYVKILTRNLAIYRALYGEGGEGGGREAPG
ncbi:MAG: transglycosylase SLT domain-containing protein [Longimicrobiaceae bacterium]